MTPEFYPKPANPTGFVIFNSQGKNGALLYLHGRGGIGYAEKAGLQGLIDSNELPPDTINGCIDNDLVLIAPRLDTYAGWSIKMIDDVLTHPAVKAIYDSNKFHGMGFSLGAGGLANYILSNPANAAKFTTANIMYTIGISGTYANAKGVKVLCVSATNDRNPGTEPSKTTVLNNGLIAAGVDSKLIMFQYGDHGGALKDYLSDDSTAPVINTSVYKWMIANNKGGVVTPPLPPTIKTIVKVVAHWSDGSTSEIK